MRKHLQHYGYFTGTFSFAVISRLLTLENVFVFQGRSEIVKKYGFIPSKAQLISSSSDSDSSSDDDENASMYRSV